MLLFTAALVAPYFIDWTNYRAEFEREMSRVLGHRVTVEGEARARLFPFPSVTFTDILVGEPADEQPLMSIREFSMDAELAPFLRGELLIFDMRIVEPQLQLVIDDAGLINWAGQSVRTFDPSQVALENVTVTDGRAIIHQASADRILELDRIDATFSAKSLSGPWRGQGHMEISGQPVGITASTGVVNDDGSMRLRISVRPDETPLMIDLDGQARVTDGIGHYAGIADLRMQPMERQPGEAHIENRVTGNFDLTHEHFSLDEFRFTSGPADNPYVATGSARVDFGTEPSFLVKADGAQIRMDAAADDAGIQGGSITLEDRFLVFQDLVQKLPKPTIPGTVSVNLPALIAGDTTIRDIAFDAEPVAQGWRLKSVGATLPGRTRFESEGLLTVGHDMSFIGRMVLAIAQPSGFAAWLASDVDDRIRRLPSAGFSADVVLSRDQQTFNNLELIVGKSRFEGKVERNSVTFRRPSLIAAFEGQDLDWPSLQGAVSLLTDGAGQGGLARHDVELTLKAHDVAAMDMAAGELDIALRLHNDTLDVDRFYLRDIARANVSATGRIENVFTTPRGTLDATVLSQDLEAFVGGLAAQYPDFFLLSHLHASAVGYPDLLKNVQLDIEATMGGTDSAKLFIEGKLDNSRLAFDLTSTAPTLCWQNCPITVNIDAHADEAATLYALAGIPAAPLGLATNARLKMDIKGDLSNLADATVSLQGDGLDGSFNGSVGLRDAEWVMRGGLKTQFDDAEPWLATAMITLPDFGLGLPLAFNADIDVDGPILVISGLDASVDGTRMTGDLNVDFGKTDPARSRPLITGMVELDRLNLGLPLAALMGSAAVQPPLEGYSDQSFATSATIPADVVLDISAGRLRLSDEVGLDDATLQMRLDASSINLSRVEGSLLGGKFSGEGALRNESGVAFMSGQFSMSGIEATRLYADAALKGSIDFNAVITGTGKSVHGLVSSLSGSGSVSILDPVISGLNENGLKNLIDRADLLGPEVKEADVASLLNEIVTTAAFAPTGTDFAFTIANGTLRVPTVHLSSDTAFLSVEGQADIARDRINLSGQFTYPKPARDDVAGADPSIRFALSGVPGALEVTYDSQPLTQYLTQRALEREQERVEHMQSILLETQRMRREVRLFETRAQQRHAAEEEAARIHAEAEAEEQRRKDEAAEVERRRKEAEEPVRNHPRPEPRPDTRTEPAVRAPSPRAPRDAPMQLIPPATRQQPQANEDTPQLNLFGGFSKTENDQRLREMFSR